MTVTSQLKYCYELPETLVAVLSQQHHSEDVFQHYVGLLVQGIPIDHRFIAVDTEWLSNSNSLRLDIIQISSFSFTIVIQLHGSKTLSPAVQSLLQDSSLLKLFKDPKEDVERLNRCLNVNVLSIYDITQMCKFLSTCCPPHNYNGDTFSICMTSLGLTPLIPKDKFFSKSNWAAPTLSPKQVIYAAYDTVFILTVYSVLTGNHLFLDVVPDKFGAWHFTTLPRLLPSTYKSLFSKFLSNVVLVDPTTKAIVADYSENRQNVFAGPCIVCKQQVICSSIHDLVAHHCFVDKTFLHMCPYCRVVEERTDASYLMHLVAHCTTNKFRNSSFVELLKQLKDERSLVNVVDDFFKFVFPVKKNRTYNQLKALRGRSAASFSLAHVYAKICALPVDSKRSVLGLVHKSIPFVFNLTLIEPSSVQMGKFNHDKVALSEKFLVLMFYVENRLKLLSKAERRKFVAKRALFREICAFLVNSPSAELSVLEDKLRGAFESLEEQRFMSTPVFFRQNTAGNCQDQEWTVELRHPKAMTPKTDTVTSPQVTSPQATSSQSNQESGQPSTICLNQSNNSNQNLQNNSSKKDEKKTNTIKTNSGQNNTLASGKKPTGNKEKPKSKKQIAAQHNSSETNNLQPSPTPQLKVDPIKVDPIEVDPIKVDPIKVDPIKMSSSTPIPSTITSNKTLTLIQQGLSKCFSKIISPSNNLCDSIIFTNLLGVCKTCKVHIPFNSNETLLVHSCFASMRRLHMCPECRSIEVRNAITFFLHLVYNCPKVPCSTVNLSLPSLLKMVKFSKITSFISTVNMIVNKYGRYSKKKPAFNNFSPQNLTVTEIESTLSKFEANKLKQLLSVIYRVIPYIFNCQCISTSFNSSYEIPADSITSTRRFLIFILLFRNHAVCDVNSSSPPDFVHIFRQMCVEVLDNSAVNWGEIVNSISLLFGNRLEDNLDASLSVLSIYRNKPFPVPNTSQNDDVTRETINKIAQSKIDTASLGVIKPSIELQINQLQGLFSNYFSSLKINENKTRLETSLSSFEGCCVTCSNSLSFNSCQTILSHSCFSKQFCVEMCPLCHVIARHNAVTFLLHLSHECRGVDPLLDTVSFVENYFQNKRRTLITNIHSIFSCFRRHLRPRPAFLNSFKKMLPGDLTIKAIKSVLKDYDVNSRSIMFNLVHFSLPYLYNGLQFDVSKFTVSSNFVEQPIHFEITTLILLFRNYIGPLSSAKRVPHGLFITSFRQLCTYMITAEVINWEFVVEQLKNTFNSTVTCNDTKSIVEDDIKASTLEPLPITKELLPSTSKISDKVTGACSKSRLVMSVEKVFSKYFSSIILDNSDTDISNISAVCLCCQSKISFNTLLELTNALKHECYSTFSRLYMCPCCYQVEHFNSVSFLIHLAVSCPAKPENLLNYFVRMENAVSIPLTNNLATLFVMFQDPKCRDFISDFNSYAQRELNSGRIDLFLQHLPKKTLTSLLKINLSFFPCLFNGVHINQRDLLKGAIPSHLSDLAHKLLIFVLLFKNYFVGTDFMNSSNNKNQVFTFFQELCTYVYTHSDPWVHVEQRLKTFTERDLWSDPLSLFSVHSSSSSLDKYTSSCDSTSLSFDSSCFQETINTDELIITIRQFLSPCFSEVFEVVTTSNFFFETSSVFSFNSLTGICKFCCKKLSFSCPDDIVHHRCFSKKTPTQLHMCLGCRSVDHRNEAFYLLHLFNDCNVPLNLLSFILKSCNFSNSLLFINISAMSSLCNQFTSSTKLLSTLFPALGRIKPSVSFIHDTVAIINANNSTDLDLFVYACIPHLFNADKVTICLGKMLKGSLSSNQTIISRRFLILIALFCDYFSDQIGVCVDDAFVPAYRSLCRYVLTSIDLDWTHLLSRLHVLFTNHRSTSTSGIPILRHDDDEIFDDNFHISDGHSSSDESCFQQFSDSSDEEEEEKDEENEDDVLLFPVLSKQFWSNLMSDSSVFNQWFSGVSKLFIGRVVPNGAYSGYGGDVQAVAVVPLSPNEICTLFSQVSPPNIDTSFSSKFLTLINEPAARLQSLPGDIVIAKFINDDVCIIRLIVLTGRRVYKCRVYLNKKGKYDFFPAQRGVPTIKSMVPFVPNSRRRIKVVLKKWNKNVKSAIGVALKP
ncbi:hypothetical protein RCL1_002788 [Eukaryota sp. TZLM3-RCL]